MGRKKQEKPVEEPPTMVKVIRDGRVRVEGNRTIRLYWGDVFRHHMARVLWNEAPDYVEAYEP